jgi:hypothetical protein
MRARGTAKHAKEYTQLKFTPTMSACSSWMMIWRALLRNLSRMNARAVSDTHKNLLMSL